MSDRVRAQIGASLADIYDVEGSKVDIERLEDRDVKLTHDMGGVGFSERFATRIRRVESGNVAQSTAFGTLLNTSLDPAHHRVLGIQVLVDVTSRCADATVSIADRFTGREFPIWVWDGTNEDTQRFAEETGSVANHLVLRPLPAYSLVPNIKVGDERGDFSSTTGMRWTYSLRGTTTAFGAGNLVLTLRVYHAFATNAGGLNSRGLPVPSW